MKSKEQLYFIAIIPPQPIFREAKELKEYFFEKYHSKAALKSPPHITLHMPFKMKEEKESHLFEVLDKISQKTAPFEVSLQGFGHFGERVIYIHVVDNDPMFLLFKALMKMMKVNFNIFNADYKSRGFHPHLTVAFRDLKKAAFRQAWPEFEGRDFDHHFKTTQMTLLKHDSKQWNVFKAFDFKA